MDLFLALIFSSQRLDVTGYKKNFVTVYDSYFCSVSDWIRIQSGQWIRIRNPYPDPEGQKGPTKIEKTSEMSCFEVLDVLF